MLALKFTYEDCVSRSELVQWRLDDVMPPTATLDFSRPFLPSSMVSVAEAVMPDEDGRRVLNQICGNAYLNLFQFVEEYILAVMLSHAQAELFGNPNAQRALSRMVDEELKHQLLFKRFRQAFDNGCGIDCGVLENAAEVAHVIMSHSPMAVMLITLHIEWMTQAHYTESVRDDHRIDPFFKKLLHHHWLEESQHARIDLLELAKLAGAASQNARERAVHEYFQILDAFDGLLLEQAKLDVGSIAALNHQTPAGLESAIHRAYQKVFLWYGVTNRNVQQSIEALAPNLTDTLEERAARYE